MSSKQHGYLLLAISCIMPTLLDSPVLYAKECASKQHVIELTIPGDTPEQNQKIEIIPFDKKIYNLAYKVYLFNNNIQDAYAIAASAVEQTTQKKLQKQNIIWRNRLAEVAIWKQNSRLAAQQYLFLVNEYHDPAVLSKGITLTTAMQIDDLLIQFLKIALRWSPNNQSIAEKMINTWLRLGDIDQINTFLKKQQNHFSSQFYWLNHAKVDSLVGNLDDELASLKQYTQEYPITPEIAIEQARLYVAEHQLNQAADVLFKAKKSALESDNDMTAYWEAYAAIAWTTNHPDEERYAYLQLMHQKTMSDQAYINLIDLYAPNSPELAYEYAKKGKLAYPGNISLAIDAFSWNIQNTAWSEFPSLDKNIPASIRRSLFEDSAYGEAKANYLQSIGLHVAAVKTFLDNINHLENNAYLKSDFIYFLIQTSDLTRLATVLSWWNNQDTFTETLWGAYAEGFTFLNRLADALATLQLYYDQFEVYQRDPYWMVGFKDLLESTNLPQQAWAVGHFAWSLYLPLLSQQKQAPDYNQLLNYSKLALQEAPADLIAMALMQMQNHVNPDTELLMLTWAFNTGDIALADGIYSYYKLIGIVPPAWAVLSLALQHEDRYLMRDILTGTGFKTSTNPGKVASYRDQVQAAQQIDAIGLAQQNAFDSLTMHPHDSDLYDNLYTPVMLKTANKISASQEFYQYANAEGPRNITSLTWFPTPSIRLKPYHSIWYSNLLASTTKITNINQNVAISSQFIQNIPNHDDREGVEIGIAQHRGEISLDIGRRSDLNTFETLRLQRDYQVFHDLGVVLDLGYHQPSEDSLGLLVGGMRNDIHLSTNLQLDAQDVFLSDYTQNFFYTQDGLHVGDGFQATFNLEHRFNLTYPDWTVGLYGTGGAFFNETNQLSGSILKLIPPGVPRTAQFLIPINFVEYGIRASFGENYMEQYTHSWRPFASVTLSNNTSVGIGNVFDVGLTGCVFGRDKLLVYYNQGSNQGSGIQLQRLAKVTYTLYF